MPIASAITADDNLSQEGAQHLAEKINTFWRAKGIEANARPVPVKVATRKAREGIWIIESDLRPQVTSGL
jgi:hypothetical protein